MPQPAFKKRNALNTLFSNKNLKPTQFEEYLKNKTKINYNNNYWLVNLIENLLKPTFPIKKTHLIKDFYELNSLTSYLIKLDLETRVRLIKKYFMCENFFQINPLHIIMSHDIDFIVYFTNLSNAQEIFNLVNLNLFELELFERVYRKVALELKKYFSNYSHDEVLIYKKINNKYNLPPIVLYCEKIRKKYENPYKIQGSPHWRYETTWSLDEFAYNQYLLNIYVSKKQTGIVKFLISQAKILGEYNYVSKSILENALKIPSNTEIILILIPHIRWTHYLEEIIKSNSNNPDQVVQENLQVIKNYLDKIAVYGKEYKN